jgi:hypothetical protein
VFRFLFTIPIAILGIDGVRPHVHINENLFATGVIPVTCVQRLLVYGCDSDFLVMLSGVGCVVSSAITLVVRTFSQYPLIVSGSFIRQIFFPRSIEGEIAARDAAKERKLLDKGILSDFSGSESQMHISNRHLNDSNLLKCEPIKQDYAPSPEGGQPHVDNGGWVEEGPEIPDTFPPLRPNRRKGDDVELGSQGLTVNSLSRHNIRVGNVNPMVTNYTSPIG